MVKKILIALTKAYSYKVVAIEETQNLDQYSRDQLYGSLTAFEMREFGTNNGAKIEIVFKAEKTKEPVQMMWRITL